MRKWLSLVGHATAGWVVCGATIAIARQLGSMGTALLIHAVVAPLAFALLTWHYFRQYPDSTPAPMAMAMFLAVAGLDALVVAPLIEHSYAMFSSVPGTWIPFVSILAASYLAGWLHKKQSAVTEGGQVQ
jgi:hypothetical protein